MSAWGPRRAASQILFLGNKGAFWCARVGSASDRRRRIPTLVTVAGGLVRRARGPTPKPTQRGPKQAKGAPTRAGGARPAPPPPPAGVQTPRPRACSSTPGWSRAPRQTTWARRGRAHARRRVWGLVFGTACVPLDTVCRAGMGLAQGRHGWSGVVGSGVEVEQTPSKRIPDCSRKEWGQAAPRPHPTPPQPSTLTPPRAPPPPRGAFAKVVQHQLDALHPLLGQRVKQAHPLLERVWSGLRACFAGGGGLGRSGAFMLGERGGLQQAFSGFTPIEARGEGSLNGAPKK